MTTGFGILGTGMIADYHRQAIEANAELGAELVAVGHYAPERFAEISERFGVPCLSEDELIAHPDVDVVCICTPSGNPPRPSDCCRQGGQARARRKAHGPHLGRRRRHDRCL